MAQFRQLRRAAEQLQRRQPALALVLGLEAERIARLELELALDRLGAGAHVAGNQDVIDEDPRTFADREHEIGLRAIRGEARLRLHGRRPVPAIGVLQLNGVDVASELRVEVRRARLQAQELAKSGFRNRRVALDADRADHRADPFRDENADRDRDLRAISRRRLGAGDRPALWPRRTRARDRALSMRGDVGIEIRVRVGLADAGPQARSKIGQRQRRAA